MEQRWLAEYAWLGSERLESRVLITATGGVFTGVSPNSEDRTAQRIQGVALPGLVNSHSHAFHRSLRGRTHSQGGDFWEWRDLMYELVGDLNPETYEDLATQVYREMAEAGITVVGEFHYLHHQPGGSPYADRNEMGHALIRAARNSGIRIALLDAGYLRSGFNDDSLNPVQQRFSDGTVDAWLDRFVELSLAYKDESDVRIGIAPHSVRALSPEDLARVADFRNSATRTHIHVSEQPSENADCVLATGVTPVGLLDRAGLLGPTTTAVHATHLTSKDIGLLGDSHTGVCYCATTERDLADGLGPSGDLHAAGAKLSVGSDSHAMIDLFEEARGIELHNRLATGHRGAFSPGSLLEAATVNGAETLGFESAGIEVGSPADLIAVSTTSWRTRGFEPTDGVGQLVFAATSSDVTDVFVAGKRIV
ncbi:MAG: formimidoylglutamate deiminase [Acidimicrobiia bacterium]